MAIFFTIVGVIAIGLFFAYDWSVNTEIKALKSTIESQQKEIVNLREDIKIMENGSCDM